MAEHLIFHDCPPETKAALQAHWARKKERIDRLLKRFPADQRNLRLTLRRRPDRHDVHAVLIMPTGTLVADVAAPEAASALDGVLDRLVAEIRRHKELLRHEAVDRRKRRRQAEFAAAAPLLEARRRQRDRTVFMELLRPVLRSLRDHAHREIVLAQLEGHLHPRELSIAELLDEVVARAWDRFESRHPAQGFDRWLVELLHEILDERLAEERTPRASLESAVPESAHQEPDNGWVVENEPFWGEPQPLTLEEVLPSAEVPEPWQLLAADEQRRWILAQLRTLPRAQRRAFSLAALEGWDENDIATLQRRPPADVRNDIDAARAILRERLDKAAEDAR